MKPFATLGSEIGKVRERVRRGADSLRSLRVTHEVRDQRDRMLAKLGEQTFRLIAEKKLVVPRVVQESAEKLAALLGVQLPVADESTVVDSGSVQEGCVTDSSVQASEEYPSDTLRVATAVHND